MKKLLRLIPVSVFVCIFLAGIIGLLIPFEFENFSYDNPVAKNNSLLNTYTVSFDIDNETDKTFENVVVTINYSTRQGFSSFENFETEITTNLAKDDNEIIFSHITTGNASSFSKINSVKLTFTNGKCFEIYSTNALFAGINWIFTCLCIVGFFGSAVFIAIYLSKRKENEFEEKDTRTFNEKIRQAFMPVADTINTLKKTYEESKRNIENGNNMEPKPKKVTCPYCKGKYSSTEDKCPHCGAPPEPCD